MAAVDYYLKIDGIPGESTKKGMEEQIEVLSWSWGESNAGSFAGSGGGGGGKVVMQDFHFSMQVCKASPKLMLACATGQHVKGATLTARKAGGTQGAYMTFKFTDLLISSYQIGGNGGSDIIPADQISFNYTKVEMEYKEQKTDGSMGNPVAVGYDLKKLDKV